LRDKGKQTQNLELIFGEMSSNFENWCKRWISRLCDWNVLLIRPAFSWLFDVFHALPHMYLLLEDYFCWYIIRVSPCPFNPVEILLSMRSNLCVRPSANELLDNSPILSILKNRLYKLLFFNFCPMTSSLFLATQTIFGRFSVRVFFVFILFTILLTPLNPRS